MSNLIDEPVVLPFGKWRSYFFPIYFHELRKFLPMMGLLMLIVFNYTILRNTKDALIVPSAGAEVIPFIKVWVVLPAAVFVTLLFTKLTNRYSQERVFYIMITGFLVLYALFAFVFYPLRDVVHPHNSANWLSVWLPEGLKGLVNMYRYWTYTGFYVISELWSSMIMTTLFWGLANEVTKLYEARRFYGVFSIAGNIAGIIASEFTVLLSDWTASPHASEAGDNWQIVMQLLVLSVIVAGVLSMGVFYWLNRNVFNDPSYETLHATIPGGKKRKRRPSLKESFTFLSNSKYLLCIAAIVVGYNLVINLVEVVWKGQVTQLYPESVDYNTYMARITIATNLLSTVAAFFMTQILAAFGWTRTALITPVIMLVTCAGFFGFLFLQGALDTTSVLLLGASPLAIAVFFGGAQNCFSRAAKYSVFDATKEMSFIPLDHESKLKGKAAIDGVGSRLGKSGGSLIHQGLLMILVTLAGITPYVAVILFAVIVVWIIAVRSLGHQFNALVEEQTQKQKTSTEESRSTWTVAPAPEVQTVNA